MKTLKVELCRGTSCHLMGSRELEDAVEAMSEIKRAEIELLSVDCLKNCRQGPNARINGVVLSGVTPERLMTILDEHFAGK